MKKIFFLSVLTLLLFCFGCSSSKREIANKESENIEYSLCQSDTDLEIFLFADGVTTPNKIYKGKDFIIRERKGEYWAIFYGEITGYIKATKLKSEVFFKAKELRNYVYDSNSFTYNYITNYSNSDSRKKNSQSNSPGNKVQVKGYTKKNGTYVAPYTRSAPRRH